MGGWRHACILLSCIGISSVGNWIYFIALNLSVLKLTESALTVSFLYIVRALSTLFTNSWAGSFIDRLNKRKLLIFLNIFQAFFILFLPFTSSLTLIFFLVFFITIGSSMFHPASMVYIAELIPEKKRKKFNSIRSLLDSGAFLTGPAIAGLLITIGSINIAIFINAIFLVGAVGLLCMLPDAETNGREMMIKRMSFSLLRRDWKTVIEFSRTHIKVMIIYFLFSAMVVLMTATDSLEVAFATLVLSLSDAQYGVLVSIAGVGIFIGSLVNAVVVEKLSIYFMMCIGAFITAIGYLVFSLSFSFLVAGIGFFILSFSLSYANTGFYTFYQNHIPVEIMGRIGSAYGLLEALLIIIATAAFGFAAELFSIRSVVGGGAILMLFIATLLFIFCVQFSSVENSRQDVQKKIL
ncbi:MFS transporter [Metabacillus sp. HB246100]